MILFFFGGSRARSHCSEKKKLMHVSTLFISCLFPCRFERDWDAIRSHLELSDENTALFLHLVLLRTSELRPGTVFPSRCPSPERRLECEQAWEAQCVKPLTRELASQLERARTTLKRQREGGVGEFVLQRMLGEARYQAVVAASTYAIDNDMAISPYWKCSETLTLDSFRRAVVNAEATAPGVAVLRRFLEVEPELPKVRHLSAVLNWHRYVFAALDGGITREQARSMTNGML